jgi:hypothetical protein
VVTDFPLGDILHTRDATGCISKWAVELGALNVDFTPRKAIKSQALANFVAEWIEIQQPTPDTILDHWKMYFDVSLKLGKSWHRCPLYLPRWETTQIRPPDTMASHK